MWLGKIYFDTISVAKIWLQLHKMAFGEYGRSSIIKYVYVYMFISLYVKSTIALLFFGSAELAYYQVDQIKSDILLDLPQSNPSPDI